MGFRVDGSLDGEGDFEVFPENWTAVRLFAALGSQWRYRLDGSRRGLDYAAITPVVLRGLGVKWSAWPAVFEDLRAMEAEVVEM